MADRYIKKSQVDGVMLARAVIQNPWIFSRRREIPKDERLTVLKKHLELFKAVEGDKKPFNTQKKYIKMYVNNFQGAQELRIRFMETKSVDEALNILREII
jgi:tRNA-dihydrouridine synthase